MIEINLLPTERKKIAPGKQPVTPVVISLCLIFVTVVVASFVSSRVINRQNQLLSQLKQDINHQKDKIKDYQTVQKELVESKKIFGKLEEIQTNADLVLKIWQRLKDVTPQKVQLTNIAIEAGTKQSLTLGAKAASVRDVALFRAKLEDLNWIESVKSDQVKIGDDGLAEFDLEITIKKNSLKDENFLSKI